MADRPPSRMPSFAAQATPPILPDVLRPGLRLVFCGTAAGKRSAAEGAYYAHPGNLFWRALFEAGLTPRLYTPAEFPLLPQLGIGLTDLAKRHAGNDDELPRGAFDVDALRQKIEQHAPRLLAFTSKTAARAAFGRPAAHPLVCGLQTERIGTTQVFVLPSPSGQARGHWTIVPWQQLGKLIRGDPPSGCLSPPLPACEPPVGRSPPYATR